MQPSENASSKAMQGAPKLDEIPSLPAARPVLPKILGSLKFMFVPSVSHYRNYPFFLQASAAAVHFLHVKRPYLPAGSGNLSLSK